ncbi:hypothetical protein GGS23DRAFT_606865 [Durotheca rogersii]|uniref:uncharacterized protein n=1 Tax=Durotheca rogersii TaxID=419775 RepID=UPI00221E9251|nr:uncharacterized protein GGS23DRAFT_606865 [Durotheca rogersii]KAI5860616.1 hypothetical protein GGS23DRAFT_606865 [Durotheca rogersii]
MSQSTAADDTEQASLAAKEGSALENILPDVIRIPFEEAVQDVKLEGWEDEWFSTGHYNVEKYGPLAEPKIDFVYNWVNGSEDEFKAIRHGYELDSPLNDKDGKWISRHSINRYRDWDELRYSLRSLDVYAKGFVNKIQLLVNSVGGASYQRDGKNMRPQRPAWLKDDDAAREHVEVLSHESFFGKRERECLPTFNSLSIESQIFRTPSSTDQLVALSDDMFLGAPHAASDFYSPLFGPAVAFKPDRYNVRRLAGPDQAPSFGEKPFVYYTSYLLNHRFGERNRHVQAHFGHSVSRSVMREVMDSFPLPSARGACERFRGESRFQLYPWFAGVHYAIERFREVLLWSFILSRSDGDGDGYLDWAERQAILAAVEAGRRELDGGSPSPSTDPSGPATAQGSSGRDRMYYKLAEELRRAGLQPPQANVNVLWTSLDGPETLRNAKCGGDAFAVDKCLGDGFGSGLSDAGGAANPDFAAATVFARLAREHPQCGDCLLKLVLEGGGGARGLEALLPPRAAATAAKRRDRDVVVRALKKYQHTVVDTDAMKFVMVRDAEQAEAELLERAVRRGRVFGQWCLNDDVMTESAEQVGRVRDVMAQVFETLWPARGRWEKEGS